MSRPALIWTIIGVLFLATLGWLFLGVPALAQRKWEAARAALIAKGEKLSLADFPQHRNIADEDNFFADPIWWELSDRVRVESEDGVSHEPRLPEHQRQLGVFRRSLDKTEVETLQKEFPEFASSISTWTQFEMMRSLWTKASKDPDPVKLRRAAEFILCAQAPAEPMVERLRELSQRPDASFPWQNGDGYWISTDHAYALGNAGKWLDLRVKALMATGDYRAAFRDAVLIFRLKEPLSRDTLLYCLSNEMNLAETFTGLMNQGIRLHAWTAEELETFARMLETVDGPRSLAAALRMERALMLEIVWPGFGPDSVVDGGRGPPPPPAWTRGIYRIASVPGDKVLYCDLTQQNLEALDAVPGQGMNAKVFPNRWEEYRKKHSGVFNEISKLLSRRWLPAQEQMIVYFAKAQTSVLLTRVGIALELYRMKNGEYPESLDALQPFLPAGMPQDLITLRPFLYERNEGGDFSLWSVGWNEKDEKGLMETDRRKGDWVWGD